MNSDRIKKDNKHSFPKFLAITLIAMVCGGFIGFFSAMAGDTALPEKIKDAVNLCLTVTVPYGLPAAVILLLGPACLLYFRAKKMFSAWDGEDEALADRIELMLSNAMLLSSLITPLQFLFLSASVVYSHMLIVAAEMLFVVVLTSMLNRRVIDLIRRMNPEKNGSFYDMKFHKKWIDSCDENEQKQIGSAAFTSYRVTSYTCLILFCVLLLGNVIFHIGLLPTFIVAVIFSVMVISYNIACRKGAKQ